MAIKINEPCLQLSVQNSKLKNRAFWFGLLGVSLAAISLRASLLRSFPLSPDEGIHLMWLRLLSAGYQPYTEVYITYPPLYPLAIQTVWNLWPTEEAQRWFSVGYTLFGAVGIAFVARKFAGSVAGVIAAALTLFSPVLVEPSRAILAEFPSVAWSVWAIWLAWLASDEWAKQGSDTSAKSNSVKSRTLLALSGLCLSASLLTKLLSPFVAILIPLILMAYWYQRQKGNHASRLTSQSEASLWDISHLTSHISHLKPLLLDLTVWGVALALPVVMLISAFNVGPLVQQVVGQRLGARTAYQEEELFWPPRYERGVMFVQEDTALVILGLVGLSLAWLRRQSGRWLMLAWLVLALAMLAFHNPIRYKHYLILIPPLAIFGGFAIAHWIYDLRFTIYDLKNVKSKIGPPKARRARHAE